jgi:hypothetical protein
MYTVWIYGIWINKLPNQAYINLTLRQTCQHTTNSPRVNCVNLLHLNYSYANSFVANINVNNVPTKVCYGGKTPSSLVFYSHLFEWFRTKTLMTLLYTPSLLTPPIYISKYPYTSNKYHISETLIPSYTSFHYSKLSIRNATIISQVYTQDCNQRSHRNPAPRPSVCQFLCKHETNLEPLKQFQYIWYCGVLLKFVNPFQVLLKLGKNSEHFTCRPKCISGVSRT